MKTKQSSSSPCTLGDTFGCVDQHKMWVDKGCDGTFDLNGVDVVCGSQAFSYTQCDIYGNVGKIYISFENILD